MIDGDKLTENLQRAVRRFTDTTTRLWVDARRRHFLDLRADPRPWWSPLRPANTNNSIVLDRYVRLIDPDVVEEIGPELAITWMLMGVVTEDSGLFRPPGGSSRADPASADP
ncbi:MAG: hypothetical protein ACOC1F_02570 [Myxococcota bacterium]